MHCSFSIHSICSLIRSIYTQFIQMLLAFGVLILSKLVFMFKVIEKNSLMNVRIYDDDNIRLVSVVKRYKKIYRTCSSRCT